MSCDYYTIARIVAFDADGNEISSYIESEKKGYFSRYLDEEDYASVEDYEAALLKHVVCPYTKSLMNDGLWFIPNKEKQSEINQSLKKALMTGSTQENEVDSKMQEIKKILRFYHIEAN